MWTTGSLETLRLLLAANTNELVTVVTLLYVRSTHIFIYIFLHSCIFFWGGDLMPQCTYGDQRTT